MSTAFHGRDTLSDSSKGNIWHLLSSSGSDYAGLSAYGTYDVDHSANKIKVNYCNCSLKVAQGSASYGYASVLCLINSTQTPTVVTTKSDGKNKHITNLKGLKKDESSGTWKTQDSDNVIVVHQFANGRGEWSSGSTKSVGVGTWYLAMWCGQSGGCSVHYDGYVTLSDAIHIYKENGSPSISLVDNGNNSYTLKGTAGTAGAGNSIKSSTLYRGTSSPASTVCSSNPWSNQTISNTTTIYGRIHDTPTYGDAKEATVSKKIIVYKAPTVVKSPTINLPSGKSRWTPKDSFTVTWSGVWKAVDTDSPIKGYRIYLYQNSSAVILKNSSGNNLTSGTTSAGNPYYDVGASTTSITIYPEKQNFKTGDKIKVGVYTWTLNGKDQRVWSVGSNDYNLWSGSKQGDSSSANFTSTVTIQPSATMRVKINANTWVESEAVYVKVAKDTWKEAEGVYVKTAANTWKEAE